MNKYIPPHITAQFVANGCTPLINHDEGYTTYWHPVSGVHLCYSLSLLVDPELLKRFPDTVVVVPDDETIRYAKAHNYPLKVIKLAALPKLIQPQHTVS